MRRSSTADPATSISARIAINASQATGFDAARYIRTMSVDDQTSAFLDSDTDLDRGGGLTVSNEYDAALDATPAAPSGNKVDHVMTIPTGSGNFTIRRIALHDDTAANVTVSSETLVAGVDGQALTKTSDFTMEITLSITYTDESV